MRIFPTLLNGHNKLRQMTYKWHALRKRKVGFTGEKEYLQEFGIKIVPAKDLLSEIIEKPKREDYYPEPPPTPEPMETLHFIGPDFVPILGQGISLAQNLCWSVIIDQLPQLVLDKQRELVPEDRQLVEQDILSSHLLDNWEVHIKDPRNLELPNKLETVYDMYRIPMFRKNELLSHSLVQTLDNTSLDPLSSIARPHLHHTSTNCSFRYKDSLVQLALAVPLFVGALTPLSPVLPPADSNLFIQPELDDKTKRMVLRKQLRVDEGTVLQQPLPDMSPLEPYIGAEKLEQYTSLHSQYVSTHLPIHPHTLHFHHNAELLQLDYDQLTAVSMLQLYSHALTYALQAGIKLNSQGHLSQPVVVQGIHSHLNLFQPCVFQLNTIGPYCSPITDSPTVAHLSSRDALAGSHVRNVFYYRQFDKLYDQCKYVVAKPTLSGVNSDLISIIRALHEM